MPVKLEDRFGNLKEGSEEEKQQRPSLAIKPDQNEWEEPLDERASMPLPSSLQLARERRARRLGRYGLCC